MERYYQGRIKRGYKEIKNPIIKLGKQADAIEKRLADIEVRLEDIKTQAKVDNDALIKNLHQTDQILSEAIGDVRHKISEVNTLSQNIYDLVVVQKVEPEPEIVNPENPEIIIKDDKDEKSEIEKENLSISPDKDIISDSNENTE